MESKKGKGSVFTFSLPKLDASALFAKYLGEKVKEAVRDKKPLSLIIIDPVDGARLEAECGAEVYADALTRLRQAVRKVLRKREDELVCDGTTRMVVKLEDTRKDEAMAVLRRVKESMQGVTIATGAVPTPIECSFNVLTYPDDMQDDDTIIRMLAHSP